MTVPVPVTFLPSAAVAWVMPGVTLLEASRAAGVLIDAPCGGRGVCGACGVKVLEGGLEAVGPDEKQALTFAPPGVRLACRASVTEAVTVRPVVSHSRTSGQRRSPTTGPLVAGVDLGTTTVSAVVIDPSRGREVGRATVPNGQRSYGADIISRLAAALESGGEGLREAASTSIVDALETAAGGDASSVERVVIAGNTAMTALLTAAPVDALASAPFAAPEAVEDPEFPEIAAAVAVGATIRTVDAIASFVGSDVLAGLVALHVESAGGPVMLVDIGTNAEVALWIEGCLYVASGPAGPAFEGVGIASGGPAVPGAVVAVRRRDDDTLVLDTIGGSPATWFCGAGLIAAAARLVEWGHLTADGTLSAAGPLSSRFSHDDAGVLRVDFGDEGAPLVLSQLDIRAIQLAKAAVRVAIEGVLAAAGVSAFSLDRLWVAGAFGNALEVEDLVALGVVPAAAARVLEAPGNTALLGAAALTLDVEAYARARELAACGQFVDLASAPGFTDSLMRAVELAPYEG